jgi:lipopolysaccharide export system protein LptA
MPVSAARLRRWFVGALVLVCVIVAGTYFYARHRVRNALKEVPGKMGIEIQQSAQGFTISKSMQGRTLFKLQASKAVQFKQGGRTELHNVTITLFGRDSSRFDQVYGEAFEYDPRSGDVSSMGEVSIDLQANPQGLLHPDQATPKELKNPVHLKTRDLVFNKNTGDAWTASTVEFRTPQASGSALGAKYMAREAALTLESQIKIVMVGTAPGTIFADRALLEKAPREIVLTRTRAESEEQKAQADELTLFLTDSNTLERALATGNVHMESGVDAGHSRRSPPASQISAQRLDVNMKPDATVRDAVMSGDVHFSNEELKGAAGRAVLEFGRHNSVSKVHADETVRLVQASAQSVAGQGLPSSPKKHNGTQEVAIAAPAMDFFVTNQRLTRAETIGVPQITLLQANTTRTSGSDGASPSGGGSNVPSANTEVTADKFIAKFDALGQLSQVHGAANVRVVSSAPPQNGAAQPDRVTTSNSIDAMFHPGTGIEALVQQGHFTYRSGTQQAFADTARYTPSDQMLTLTGSPRILDEGMVTTARTLRLNRVTGEGSAEGDVKTSYSDLKAQPNGALLATSDPVHVTAQKMATLANLGSATYTGNARLWQNANVIEAPFLQFQKDQRTVVADSEGGQKVSTVLVGTDKCGKATPVTVTSGHLVYRDSERKAHLSSGVSVRGSDLTITAKQMDVFLASRAKTSTDETPLAPPIAGAGPAHLDRIVASGAVVITEPNRRATGEQLTYTASDDKFVLTGGPPCIFDAEHGKITAVSLTLFRRDGRVVVEGDSKSPAVTETQVVR